MSDIESGTLVRVVIEGKYDTGKYTWANVETAEGDYDFDLTDPAVTVTPIDQETIAEEEAPKLDPFPYVDAQGYRHEHTSRTLDPRQGYSQNPEDYA